MKNKFIKVLAVAALAGASLTSCNDFLTIDPTDKLVQETFFDSPEMVRANSLTIYNAKTWSNYFMNASWKLDMINGDLFYTYDQEGQWFFGSYTPVNTYLKEGWNGLYNVIAYCNSVINDMPRNVSGTVTQAHVDAAVAEARCVRALCYYLLTEQWGDVPIIYNNTENISTNKIDVPRNTQKSIYRFALEDLDYAVEKLPVSDQDAFRCTKTTAHAFRARLLVTMASHTDYGYDRAALYAQAAQDAMYVMDNRPWLTEIDYSTLFDVETNNGPESIFQIQCGVLGYSFGNNRNVSWARSSIIADQQWGGAKCPTIAVQTIFNEYPHDKRRMWTYMQQGDHYSMLNRANGGYDYKIVNRGEDGTVLEDRNECNAHVKKYIIGKSADCNGNVGLNQDAANNLYLMRLADVYLLYAEAVMGTADVTTDATALQRFNAVRERAGIATVNSLTYEELMKERIREFTFESLSWFDTQRLRYRKGDAAALDWLNTGFHTGYNRATQYNPVYGMDQADECKPESYELVQSKAEYAQYDPIILTASAFECPIPAAVSTASPALAGEPVDFYEGKAEEETPAE